MLLGEAGSLTNSTMHMPQEYNITSSTVFYKVMIMMPKPVLWHHKDDSSEIQGTSIDNVSIYRINCTKI